MFRRGSAVFALPYLKHYAFAQEVLGSYLATPIKCSILVTDFS